METNFFKDNPLATLTTLVIYFGACAGLWHIGYWSVFDINYFQYIEISDIIKDFAQPLFTSAFTALFSFAIGSLINVVTKKRDVEPDMVVQEDLKLKQIMIWLVVVLFVIVLSFSDKYTRLRFMPFVIGLIISSILLKNDFLKDQISNFDLRFLFVNFMVLLPLFSYYFSKANSLEVKDNIKYKYISSINFVGDKDINFVTKKVVGASRTSIFLTDYCNNKIQIINLSNVAAITYTQVEKKTVPFSVKNFPFFVE